MRPKHDTLRVIIIAAGDGAKAALSAFDHLIRHDADSTALPQAAPMKLAA